MADRKAKELVKIVRALCDWIDATSTDEYANAHEVYPELRQLIDAMDKVTFHMANGFYHMSEYHGRLMVWEARKAAAELMVEPIPPEPKD